MRRPSEVAAALRVASGVSPDVEGGILPPGLKLQILPKLDLTLLRAPKVTVREIGKACAFSTISRGSMPFPPGRMPGSTADETPAATSVRRLCALILLTLSLPS